MVTELYAALNALNDINVSFNELEGRNCSELAIFGESLLVSLCYTGTDGNSPTTIMEYWDSGLFFIPYAVDEAWHQVEIVKIGTNIYSACDGIVLTINPSTNILTLGGECGVIFRDFEVSVNSSSDAEYADDRIISSVNPMITITEGHGMRSIPSYRIENPSTSMLLTPDRLYHIFEYMKKKGYVPVSVDEVFEYYCGNRTLPKRCYFPVFDDYEFENCLDIKNRQVFNSFGVKPVLAIISSYSETQRIIYNGEQITILQAAEICKEQNFHLVSHTRNHRSCTSVKVSNYISELTSDIYDQDLKSIDSSILVYPYGETNMYLYEVLKWIGFRLGINVAYGSKYNYFARKRFNLFRDEIGLRTSLNNVFSKII